MKGFLIAVFFFAVANSLFAQHGNIPKGYHPHITVVPPDTTQPITNVHWIYGDSGLMVVQYGYRWEKPNYLIINTKTWKPERWIQPQEKIDEFLGFTGDGKSMIFTRTKWFLSIRINEYWVVDIERCDKQLLKQKEFEDFKKQRGKLQRMKSFQLQNQSLLSPDRNYYIINSRQDLLLNRPFPDEFVHKPWELVVWKYHKA